MLPGLTQITWSSMNFSNFINTVSQKINEFRLFLKQVEYIAVYITNPCRMSGYIITACIYMYMSMFHQRRLRNGKSCLNKNSVIRIATKRTETSQ